MSNLEKINVLTKDKLDSLDLTQYPNQIFGTTDEVAGAGGGSGDMVSNEAIAFAESERQKSKNLFDKNGVILNTWLEGGKDKPHDGYFTTNYIKIDGNQYTVSATSLNSGSTQAFYDADKNYLNEGSLSTLTGTITPPANAVYVRSNYKIEELNNNIQYEIGTQATEYQPYNGAIVHEGDIVGVEVLYDKNDPTKQTFGGTAYTGGILGNTTITGFDLSKYKRLDIEYMTDVFCGRVSLGLTNPFPEESLNPQEYPYMTSSCVVSESHQSVYYIRVGVNLAKTTFKLIDVGFTRIADATVNDRSSHPAYYIYKIEGVLA